MENLPNISRILQTGHFRIRDRDIGVCRPFLVTACLHPDFCLKQGWSRAGEISALWVEPRILKTFEMDILAAENFQFYRVIFKNVIIYPLIIIIVAL